MMRALVLVAALSAQSAIAADGVRNVVLVHGAHSLSHGGRC